MSLTKLSLNLFTTSFIFLGLGMAFGSLPLIIAGFTPLIFLGLSLTLPEIESVEIDPVEEQLEVLRGEVIELTRAVTIRGGVGYITLYEEVPEPFELVEGENLQLHVKDSRDLRICFSYKLRCTRRGIYEFNEVSYSIRHVLEATTSRKGVLKLSQRIVVKPPRTSVSRIKDHKQWTALPLPSDSKMQLGIVSHDFKELKTYVGGDPYKHINWKATARTIHTSTDLPIVNEYEREGNKVVWLFLDASPRMELGNNVTNSFEYAVEATLGLAEYYLSRRCVVGFSLYNDDAVSQPNSLFLQESYIEQKKRTPLDLISDDSNPQRKGSSIEGQSSSKLFNLPPEAGRQQLRRIENLLQSMPVSMVPLSLKQALRLNKTHLDYANPTIFMITSVRAQKMDLLQGELIYLERTSAKSSRGQKHTFLINVQGYSLSSKTDAERVAAQIMTYEEENLLRRAITRNVTVINWDPSETNFTTLITEASQR
jgi:uncharacterized protein (DUF58 family)